MSPAARPPPRWLPRTRLPRTRAEQKQETRRRIVEAAVELFELLGYQGTSTRAIARRAEVASGTVFKHAADKEELLFLVMHDRLAATVERALTTLPKGRLLEQLMYVFGALYHLYGSMPSVGKPFLRLAAGARGPNGQQVDALTFAFVGRLGTLVRAAQQRGEISKEVDPFQLAQNLFALYFAGLFSWLGGYATIEAALDPGLRQALALQLRGLGPR